MKSQSAYRSRSTEELPSEEPVLSGDKESRVLCGKGSVLTAWQYHRNNGLFQAGEMLFHMDMYGGCTKGIAEHHDRICPA